MFLFIFLLFYISLDYFRCGNINVINFCSFITVNVVSYVFGTTANVTEYVIIFNCVIIGLDDGDGGG